MEGTGDEEDLVPHGLHKKKHKKHKKHKKKHHQEGGSTSLHGHHRSDTKAPPKPQLRLKIKLGGQVLGTKSVPTFTVIPEQSCSQSPLMVVDEDDEPLEGVPIEQYRAWLGLWGIPEHSCSQSPLMVVDEDDEPLEGVPKSSTGHGWNSNIPIVQRAEQQTAGTSHLGDGGRFTPFSTSSGHRRETAAVAQVSSPCCLLLFLVVCNLLGSHVSPDEDSNMDPLPSPTGPPVTEQDEETRWLDALERGELDVNGDLKRETDETLLTARQRALLQKQQTPAAPLYPPAVYTRPPQEMSQEMLVKREEKARKRRLQAAKKAEESKKQTIERLTKTSKSRGTKPTSGKRGGRQPPCPTIRYQNNAQSITVSYPAGVPYPAPAEPRTALPAPQLCGAPGCPNPKKYSCSKTGVPLCSLECYHRNLALHTRHSADGGPGTLTERIM